MNSRGIAWRPSFHERVNFAVPPAVMAVMAVVSTVMSVASAIQQGETARKQAGYQAALAENNAIAARQQAEFDERQHREKARLALSAQRARTAKSGVLASEGSPLFFNIDTSEGAEIDSLNIRRQGQMRAQGYQSEAALSLFKGKAAQQQGYLGATKSLLDGVSRTNWSAFGSTPASTGTAGAMTQDIHDFMYETGAWGPT